MSYGNYIKCVGIIYYAVYPVRWLFWTALYFYNKLKYPNGSFTLKLYQSYAKK